MSDQSPDPPPPDDAGRPRTKRRRRTGPRDVARRVLARSLDNLTHELYQNRPESILWQAKDLIRNLSDAVRDFPSDDAAFEKDRLFCGDLIDEARTIVLVLANVIVRAGAADLARGLPDVLAALPGGSVAVSGFTQLARVAEEVAGVLPLLGPDDASALARTHWARLKKVVGIGANLEYLTGAGPTAGAAPPADGAAHPNGKVGGRLRGGRRPETA